jgi:hypothetical protein
MLEQSRVVDERKRATSPTPFETQQREIVAVFTNVFEYYTREVKVDDVGLKLIESVFLAHEVKVSPAQHSHGRATCKMPAARSKN